MVYATVPHSGFSPISASCLPKVFYVHTLVNSDSGFEGYLSPNVFVLLLEQSPSPPPHRSPMASPSHTKSARATTASGGSPPDSETPRNANKYHSTGGIRLVSPSLNPKGKARKTPRTPCATYSTLPFPILTFLFEICS